MRNLPLLILFISLGVTSIEARAAAHKIESPADMKRFCHANVGMISTEPGAARGAFATCRQIHNSDLRAFCQANAYMSRFLRWNQTSSRYSRQICETVHATDLRHLCEASQNIVESPGTVQKFALGECGEILDTDLNEFCMSSVYGNKLDRVDESPELCSAIENHNWRHACVANFHARRNTPADVLYAAEECDLIGKSSEGDELEE